MKKVLRLVCVVLLVMSYWCAVAETNENASYLGEFRDMSIKEFLEDRGNGYGNGYFATANDFTIFYDEFLSPPVQLNFRIWSSQNEYCSDFWRWTLRTGKTESITFSLNTLPRLPASMNYDNYCLDVGMTAQQDVAMTVQVENARIELEDGTEIPLPDICGVFEVQAECEAPNIYNRWGNDLWAGIGGNSFDIPQTEIRKATFKADATLLFSQGPSKTEYYQLLTTGLPRPSVEWFRFLKQEGFDHIRFQVTWYNFINDETNQIDPEWLATVAEVVNNALDAEMYCSINLNWDCVSEGQVRTDLSSFTREQERQIAVQGLNWLNTDGHPETEARFGAVWTQIAEYFKNYDEHLSFESINEPQGTEDNEDAVHNLNRLNQIFVDSVRSTGGNNEERFLIVTPLHERAENRTMEAFEMPEDPSNHTLVGINMYMGENTDEVFNTIDEYLLSKGFYATFMEFGSSVYQGSLNERVEWTREQVRKAEERGIPVCWFAHNIGANEINGSTIDPAFCLYNPFRMEPIYPELIELLVD